MQTTIWGQVYLVHFRQNIDNGWLEKTRCGWICFRSFSGHRWPHGIREEKVDHSSFDLDIIFASVHLLEKNLISGIVQVCAISSCGSYIWRSGSIRSLWCKKGIPWSDALCKCDVATIYMMRMLLLDIICGQLLLPGFRKSRNSLCRSCCGRATWDGNGSQVIIWEWVLWMLLGQFLALRRALKSKSFMPAGAVSILSIAMLTKYRYNINIKTYEGYERYLS